MQGYSPAGAPYGMGAPPGAPQAPGATYEFNDVQNQTIRSTARYAKVWGIISIVTGFLAIGVAVAFAVAGASLGKGNVGPVVAAAAAPTGITNIVCGFFYLGAAGSLAAVVDTQGNDIALLLRAVDRMKLAFMIEAIVAVLAFIGGFVAGIALRAGGS